MIAEVLSVTSVLVSAASLAVSLYGRSNRTKHVDAAVASLRSDHQSAKASHEANLKRRIESSPRN